MDDAAARRAEQIWQGIQLSAHRHLPDGARQTFLHVVREYGNARFEQGRAHESDVVARRTDEIELQRQQAEFQRRLRERAVLR